MCFDFALHTTKHPKSSLKYPCIMQKYRVGTIISKQFEVPGQQKLRYYRGEVSAYYPEHQLYCVVYEDGDSEEMEEEYVTFYLAAALKKKTSPKKKRENMVEKCWRNSLLAAADKTIELAKSPQRKRTPLSLMPHQ